MKKIMRYLLVIAMVLCMVQPAFAEAPITVQLDGQNLTFTDAQPRVIGERTYLPMRAVLEAMGVTVGFKDDVITAARGSKSISMTDGSTTATITRDGVSETVELDAAPFIDAHLRRTYIPAELISTAFDAAVGWDAKANTVVIVDTEKQVAAAIEGKSFTLLDKLAAHSDKYSKGIWTGDVVVTGTVNLNVDMSEEENGSDEMRLKASIPVLFSFQSVSQDETDIEASGKLTLDLLEITEFTRKLIGTNGVTEEDQAELETLAAALRENGVSFGLRYNEATNRLYLNLDLSALDDGSGELPSKDVWYYLEDDENGRDTEDVLEGVKHFDYTVLLETILSGVSVDDAKEGYPLFKAAANGLAERLSDSGFINSGDNYATSVSQRFGGIIATLKIAMIMKDDVVTACGFDLNVNGNFSGEEGDKLSLDLNFNIDENDVISGAMFLTLGEEASINCDITGSYTNSGEAPHGTPPEGAPLVDLITILLGEE